MRWVVFPNGLPDRVFDRNPEVDDQPGLFVYLNTGNGFDNGKQWQSSLGGDYKLVLTFSLGVLYGFE
jgi:hypothetical protein